MSLKVYISFLLIVASSGVFGDWHTGKIQQMNVGYDGKTVTVKLEGWARTNCSCLSYWPEMMCLDYSRDTANFERSLLLSAKARSQQLSIYIDETTCLVQAMYEVE